MGFYWFYTIDNDLHSNKIMVHDLMYPTVYTLCSAARTTMEHYIFDNIENKNKLVLSEFHEPM